MSKIKDEKIDKLEITDQVIEWIGTKGSLIFHTIVFVAAFLSPFLLPITFDLVLLILTTLVSLEAIYLAIFIQRSVNQQATRLGEVEESLDDVEESLDDVEESLDDMEESLDDVEESIDEVEESLSSTGNKNIVSRQDKLDKTLKEIMAELREIKSSLGENSTGTKTKPTLVQKPKTAADIAKKS